VSVSSRHDAPSSATAEQGILFVHLARARKLLQQGKYDIARQELELALLARPDDEDVLNLLSVAEFKRGNYHEAARAARTLLRNNPGSAILHANLGLIQFKAGVLGEAEDELRRAIDLQPDHARSHLHLGLLYRMRGKLGLALEHLRFAGAKRVVAELEEALRKAAREPPSARAATRPAAPVPAPPPPEETPAAPALRLAPPSRPMVSTSPATPGTEFLGEPQGKGTAQGEPEGREPEARTAELPAPAESDVWETIEAPFPEAELAEPAAEGRAAAAPGVSGQAEAEAEADAAKADAHPLFLVRPDGGLEITSRDVVFVRRGSVVWYSGKMRFAPEASFRGTRLEKILRADGKGHLFVNDPGRQAFRRDLAGQSLFVEGTRILALDHGLSFRLEPVHDFRMNRRVDVLKIHGTGSVVLSVGGALLAHEVSPDFPLNVSSRDLVAWTGDLVPSVLEDRFLEEVMMPDVGSAPKIRFEGTGTVLTEPPRPRRRASDVARSGENDRRSS
jgi:tetratricopeptide (TPR) repeat protein/uncharacterized protein (AIM24 family)